MESLNTQTVNTTFVTPITSYQGGPGFKFEVPQSTVMLAKPVSYEFRVVEHVENGKIVRVGLQYQMWEHDNYGAGQVKIGWTDVKRVQKDVATGAITDIMQV